MNPLPVLLLSLLVVAANAASDNLVEAKIDGPGCGHRNPPYTEPMISPYVVNGEPAPPYVYPFICIVFDGTRQVCGGSLITNSTGQYWFITAAHCLESGLDGHYIIRCGIYNTEGPSQPFEFRPRYFRPIIHEGYDEWLKNNDIALFPLYQDAFPKERVGAVCISRQNKKQDERVVVLGWGRIREMRGFQDVPYSSTLNMGLVYVMNDTDCSTILGDLYNRDTMLCAGNPATNTDACQGDSGGPLVAERNGELQLIAITSFGWGCATIGYPGVYVDVTKMKPWINSKINAWAPEVVG